MLTNGHHFSDRFLFNDVGVWEWNIQTGEVHVNERWAQIVGYTHQELEPISIATWEMLLHPEDVEDSERAIQKHIAGLAEYYECEVRMRHKNGGWIWIIDRGQIITWSEDGKPEWMSGYHLDITQKKLSQEALNANQILLQNIIDEMPDVFVLKDAHGDFLLCNQTVAKLYQTTPQEMIGKSDEDFGVPKELSDFFRQNVLSIMASGETQVVYEDSKDAQSGAIRHFRSIKKPIKDSDGNNQILVIAQDITDIIEANAKIAENEKRLQYVMEATQEGVWDWNIIENTVYHNEQWYALLGYDDGEIEDSLNGFKRLIHPDDLPIVWERLERLLSGETTSYYSEHRMINKDGSIMWVQDRGKIVEYGNGKKPLRMVGSYTNITRRKEYEQTLRLSANVFTHAKEGIMITDPLGVIIEVNDSFTVITGFSHDEVIGATPRILKSDEHSSIFFDQMWEQLREEGYWNGEIWNKHKSGYSFPISQTITAVRNDKEEILYYVALFSDITTQKQHEEELDHIAHYDLLTALPNRLLLAERLEQAMLSCALQNRSIAIAYIDLDGFKEINDQHGHSIGDELLKQISHRMLQALRNEDMLARLGGDEFVAVIECDHELSNKEHIIHRLLNAASETVEIEGFAIRVSASIGLSYYPQSSPIDAEQLLRQADHAMYQAKLSGKNCFHIFDTANDQSIRKHHETIHEIEIALKQDEFILYYQPKIDLETKEPVGMEALIRWNHPKKGILSPAFFIPETEYHPLGIAIGEWVIKTALHELKSLQNEGIFLPISVNITANHFQQTNFVDRLKTLLGNEPTIDPSLLELEVLESSAIHDIHYVINVMEECTRLGVRFSLDDFGTGFSSLSYLKRLPVHTIKIDQSFVRDMLKDTENAKIIEGIMGLAKAFDRSVVAEGIESKEHIQALLDLGCRYGQGYAIAYPMPSSMLRLWLSEYTTA